MIGTSLATQPGTAVRRAQRLFWICRLEKIDLWVCGIEYKPGHSGYHLLPIPSLSSAPLGLLHRCNSNCPDSGLATPIILANRWSCGSTSDCRTRLDLPVHLQKDLCDRTAPAEPAGGGGASLGVCRRYRPMPVPSRAALTSGQACVQVIQIFSIGR